MLLMQFPAEEWFLVSFVSVVRKVGKAWVFPGWPDSIEVGLGLLCCVAREKNQNNPPICWTHQIILQFLWFDKSLNYITSVNRYGQGVLEGIGIINKSRIMFCLDFFCFFFFNTSKRLFRTVILSCHGSMQHLCKLFDLNYFVTIKQ